MEDMPMAMSAEFPSSGALPPDPPSTPSVDVETPEQRRRRVLASESLRRSIRKTARAHSVPEEDIEDIIHDMIEAALRADLPDDETEIRRYVNRIAANLCVDLMRERDAHPVARYVDDIGPDDDDPAESERPAVSAAVQAVAYEDRDAALRLINKGRQKFPKWFAVFLRSRLNQETSDEVARRHRVASSHIRHEWSSIERFMHDYGRATGLSLAVIFAIVAGLALRDWRKPADFSGYATYEEHRTRPPPPTADDLRRHGMAACDASAWQACADDLDAAYELDPAGEEFSVHEMRFKAKTFVRNPEPAKPSSP
jgi:DNA-directed RNA polymerase specialized sigma24 family protein